MVTANATIGAQHSVNLAAVHELSVFLRDNDCAIEFIRFDLIVPANNESEVGQVERRLREWKNLIGTAWPNAPDAASYVAAGALLLQMLPSQGSGMCVVCGV